MLSVIIHSENYVLFIRFDVYLRVIIGLKCSINFKNGVNHLLNCCIVFFLYGEFFTKICDNFASCNNIDPIFVFDAFDLSELNFNVGMVNCLTIYNSIETTFKFYPVILVQIHFFLLTLSTSYTFLQLMIFSYVSSKPVVNKSNW
ncbi:hypothetical protein DMUE_1218 [Dictyocoela muelleri]|nr:hypothetical protein DMUE_1218 [Dictyocoela muelleri]